MPAKNRRAIDKGATGTSKFYKFGVAKLIISGQCRLVKPGVRMIRIVLPRIEKVLLSENHLVSVTTLIRAWIKIGELRITLS